MTVAVGRVAVVVATDDAQVAAHLAPWRIEDLAGPTDYCLDLSPDACDGDAGPRPLPGLWHGSMPLIRTSDGPRVIDTLLRVLSAHAREPGPGQLRVEFMPLIRDAIALLVPPSRISALADRRLRAAGVAAVHTVSSLIDVDAARVLIDPPLGGSGERTEVPLGGWWRPLGEAATEPTLGELVAEVMQTVVGVTVDNAAATLHHVVDLVQRVPPILVPPGAGDDLSDLVFALDAAVGHARAVDR